MAKKKITEIVESMISEFLEENGYELYNTEFLKEGRDWFLRVYIDMKAGSEQSNVGTEDCEKVSRFLSEALDREDPIEQNYYLEVSSPGMDRPLLKPEHYRRYIGEAVEVKLYKAVEGVKNLEGTLAGFEESDQGFVIKIVDCSEKCWELQMSDIARTKLAVIF